MELQQCIKMGVASSSLKKRDLITIPKLVVHFFPAIKPTSCTNFSKLFWKETLTLLTACEQDQDGTAFHPDPARKLSANLYVIYHCCVYSEKLLVMDRGTVRNI
jgi:hypothetical protein